MQEPHDLIKDFIDKKLQGNLHRLVNFDLTQLRGDRKYGSCNGGRFDCDNTALARAIYALVFDDVWEDMKYETLREKKYRGDTINTIGNLMVLPNSRLKELFYYLNGRFIFQVLR